MNLRRKMSLAIGAAGTVAAMAAPLATVVSCGNSSKTIRLGIRAEEADLFRPAIKQFEAATGWKVELANVDSQSENYALWGTSRIPEVTITDAGAMKLGYDEKARAGNFWFKALDMKDLMENENYMLDNTKITDDKYKEENIKFDKNNFNLEMLSSGLREDGKYYGMPLVYGPKLLYTWKNLAGKQLIEDDASKATDLKWFVPKKDGGVEEVTFSGTTHATNPLLKKDNTTHYKNTTADIQEFINDAADADQIGLNFGGKTPNAALASSTPLDRVIATGTYGQTQRLVSLGKSVLDGKDTTNKVVASVLSDAGFNFSAIIQGASGYAANGKSNVAEKDGKTTGALDDAKWITPYTKSTFDPKSNTIDGAAKTAATPTEDAKSDTMAASYLGNFGYFVPNAHAMANNLSIKGVGTDAFAGFVKEKVFALPGAAWQKGGIISSLESTKKSVNDLTAFSIPFFESGIDGYSLNAKVSGDKEVISKKLLRFLMQKQVSADIASDKTFAVRKQGYDVQLQKWSGDQFVTALKNGGHKQVANGIDTPYVVSKVSTENTFDLYNNAFLTMAWDGVTQGTSKAISFEEYSKHLNEIATKLKANAEAAA